MTNEDGRARRALVLALRDLTTAVTEMTAALALIHEGARRLIEDLEAGTGARDAYRKLGLREVRERAFSATRQFNSAFERTRASAIRLFVDEEGATFTDVARMVGRSRQFVTRLYHQAYRR